MSENIESVSSHTAIATKAVDPVAMLRPRRKITGISAILLPFARSGEVDWPSFEAHVRRTADAGLTPAVNMDTGYVHLLDDATRLSVLERARQILAGAPFVAGAFVKDASGSHFDLDAYLRQMDAIQLYGGTPVIFQSFGLVEQNEVDVERAYRQIGERCDRYIGFELGQIFAPFGRIYSLELFAQLLEIPACVGIKHSSLHRELEWQRLIIRDQRRPEFQVFTGNDLAIDMVMYGSDYLLGLSTFAPDLFAKRDAYWLAGDAKFYELNDLLQYLGFLAFRAPVPAYKHSAAIFLRQCNWIQTDKTHPGSPTRPASERAVLQDICDRLQTLRERP